MNAAKLEIKVLGGLELRYQEKIIGVNGVKGKSRKMWTLLEYILLNHERKVSQEELIEILWADMDVSDPANSLKVLVFKLRKEIDSLGYVPGKELILSVGGSYCLNHEIPYILDICEFEKYKKQAEEGNLSDEETLRLLHSARNCYKGNVLNNVRREPWAATVQVHYGDLYRQVINRIQKILEEKQDHAKIIEICWAALLIQPYVEEYYYHMIKAYAAMENYSAASDMYAEVKEVMQKEYGSTPDSKFEGAYKEIMKARPKKNLTVEELTEEFKERNNYFATFFVEYGEFRQIYRLTARRVGRLDHKAYMCLYTLGAQRGAEISKKEKNKHLRILGEALAFVLREGDVFTRATPNQFAVIFNEISVENAEAIAVRIKRYFDRHKKSEEFGILHTYAKITASDFGTRLAEMNQNCK